DPGVTVGGAGWMTCGDGPRAVRRLWIVWRGDEPSMPERPAHAPLGPGSPAPTRRGPTPRSGATAPPPRRPVPFAAPPRPADPPVRRPTSPRPPVATDRPRATWTTWPAAPCRWSTRSGRGRGACWRRGPHGWLHRADGPRGRGGVGARVGVVDHV